MAGCMPCRNPAVSPCSCSGLQERRHRRLRHANARRGMHPGLRQPRPVRAPPCSVLIPRACTLLTMFYHVRDMPRRRVCRQSPMSVAAMAWSRSGHSLTAAYAKGLLCRWDMRKAKPVRTLASCSCVACLVLTLHTHQPAHSRRICSHANAGGPQPQKCTSAGPHAADTARDHRPKHTRQDTCGPHHLCARGARADAR